MLNRVSRAGDIRPRGNLSHRRVAGLAGLGVSALAATPDERQPASRAQHAGLLRDDGERAGNRGAADPGISIDTLPKDDPAGDYRPHRISLYNLAGHQLWTCVLS